MNGAASSGHEVRPRPVADAPIDSLLERDDELAKCWVMALVRARPLDEIGHLPLAEIAALAPAQCAGVLRAVRSDGALGLEGARGGSVRRGRSSRSGEYLRLPWDDEPRALVVAVEALRGVLWDALVRVAGATNLAGPSDRLLSDLADRLSYVCSVVLTRSLPARVEARLTAPRVRAASAIARESPPWGETAVAGERPRHAAAPAQEAEAVRGGAPTAARASAVSSRVVLVDEFSDPAAGRRVPAGRVAGHPADGAGTFGGTPQETLRADARALPWDIPLDGAEALPDRAVREAHERSNPDVPSISITRRRRPRERE